MAIVYLCNGNKPECKGSPSCLNECKHTKDVAYAKNFKKEVYGNGAYAEYVEEEKKDWWDCYK